jgi:hypothetical protein
VDDELQFVLAGMFARPAHDELLGVAIQIPFMEGRGIHRVEELTQLIQLQFNQSCHVRVRDDSIRNREADSSQAERETDSRTCLSRENSKNFA